MDPAPLTATYRVQLNAGFTLADAVALVPYLERLGVSHLYSSPLLTANPGSLHGYDVVDPTRLNAEIGSEDELRALASALHERGMGMILDIVPNHMGTGPANVFWEDVLANGRRSRWADWFDVDWDSERQSLRGRVLVPVLGDTLETVLERGELSLSREGERIRLKYADRSFPLSPDTERELAGHDLSRWHHGAAGRKRMREIMDAQRYRLAFWKRAPVAINYRRFFDVTELIAIRIHEPAVFRETHALVLRWVEDRVIDGLRIDHIDGLLDPQGYLDSLRVEVTQRRSTPLPIVVEKILSTGERLRESWPVQGTTGYEFLNDLEAAFIDSDGAARLDEGYRRTLGSRARGGFEEAAIRGKELVLRTALASDVSRLAKLLREALRARRGREARGATAAIRHFIASLPVYRTYIDGRGTIHPGDRDVIARAVARSRERWGERAELDRLASVLRGENDAKSFVDRLQQTSGPATAKGVEDTALYRYAPLASLNEVGGDPGRNLGDAIPRLHRANAERRTHWPVSLLCTSTHDTKRSADVRSRLDVLSEMPDEWLRVVRRWRRMLAGHRVRVRGGYAPDPATEWLIFQSLLGIWPAERTAQAAGALRAGREVRDRVVEYMRKANREAKVRTSWTSPDERYEAAVDSYIDAALANETFVAEMADCARRVAPAGYCNALSRLLVHLTSPGTPDIYQGDELWNFTLVDPDNRRPVDFAARQTALDRVDAALQSGDRADACAEMLRAVPDGRIKMFLTATVLRLRREKTDLFVRGTYTPLHIRGQHERHSFAFARAAEGVTILTAVTRLPLSLAGGDGVPTGLAWGDTAIMFPSGGVPHRWRCALSGRTVETQQGAGDARLLARDVFSTLPVALLLAV